MIVRNAARKAAFNKRKTVNYSIVDSQQLLPFKDRKLADLKRDKTILLKQDMPD